MLCRRPILPALLIVFLLWVATPAAEKVLYETQSPYNAIIVTEDERGLRTLMFERYGARQSVVKIGDPDHIEFPYPKAMLIGLALVEQPKRMLVVGLGGGTIPSFLHKHYPAVTIDVVDIDPEVVRVAKEYFGFRETATMRVHVADGRRFIEDCREPYDLIFLDAYGATEIPYHLATQQFLVAVRRALSPGGVAVANVWSRGLNRLYDSMVRTYQSVFDELYVLDVRGSGNRILFALPRHQEVRRADLARRASAISQEQQFRFDMGRLLASGFRRPGEVSPRHPILMDKAATTTATSTQPAETRPSIGVLSR